MGQPFSFFRFRTREPMRAKLFYEELFGWTVGGDELLLRMGPEDAPWGCIEHLPPRAAQQGAPSHWLGCLGTDAPHAKAASLEAAGARRLGPAPSPQVRASHDGACRDGTSHDRTPHDEVERPIASPLPAFQDPFGAVLGLHPAVPSPPAPVLWSQLLTAEPDEAFGFYKAHFGWHSLRKCPLGPMFGELLEWSANELSEEADGGIFDMRAPAFASGVPHWLFAFEVANVDQSLARARALGADLVSGPHPLPCGYQLAVLHDPQGAVFGVTSRG